MNDTILGGLHNMLGNVASIAHLTLSPNSATEEPRQELESVPSRTIQPLSHPKPHELSSQKSETISNGFSTPMTTSNSQTRRSEIPPLRVRRGPVRSESG